MKAMSLSHIYLLHRLTIDALMNVMACMSMGICQNAIGRFMDYIIIVLAEDTPKKGVRTFL